MTIHRKRIALTSAFVIAICLLTSASAPAQNAQSAREFVQTAISPDGNSVAWVESSLDVIHVQDLRSSNPEPRTIATANGSHAESIGNIAWSPDSRHLAFLSDAGNAGQYELYIVGPDGGSRRKLTNLTGFLSHPAWSPDEKSIAFLFTENAPRAAGPLMPMTPETGVIDQKVYEQRLALVDLASGKVRQLSPPDMYVYEYDWSPDGKNFASIAAHGAGDANWYVAQLYTLNVDSSQLKPIYKPGLQMAVPRWSPDGKNIAFISGLMSDEGAVGGDIFIAPVAGGEVRNVTPGITASPSSLDWQTAEKILFAETIDGEVGVSTVEVPSGKISLLWRGAGVITADPEEGTTVSLSADRRQSAVIRDTSTHPPEIWIGPVGEWKQVTHLNDDIHPAWGEMKSLHWVNGDVKLQGWLLYPMNYDPSKRYPMVVIVHGGPASSAHVGWSDQFFNTYELSARGYFVLYPNPRGSFGQGERFTEANVKDFGYGDFRDILAGVDEVVKILPVDNDRIGITGWSYGGYMTMWAVTQTGRFRAAVAGAGLSNWLSYYGENDIDEWMPPYFGASVYDDPAVYAKSAPMTFIKNAKTPTLVLVGEHDGECPVPQSREFWHALKSLGIETQLVIYPGEGHQFLDPEHRRDRMERLVGWFDHYLKPQASAQKH